MASEIIERARVRGFASVARTLNKERIWRSACVFCVALLLSRVVLLDCIAPIGPALLCAALAAGVYPAACLLGCLAGAATLWGTAAVGALPAVAALGLAGLWLRSRDKATCAQRRKVKGKPLLWLMAVFVAGVELAVRLPAHQGAVRDVLLLAGVQTAIACVLYPILYRALGVMDNQRRRMAGLAEEEWICLAVMSGLLLLGIAPVYIAWFWPAGVMAALVTLIFARVGGAGIGAGSGLMIGLSLSLATAPDAVLICSLAAIGFLAGSLRSRGSWGCALGSLAAGGLLLAYTGDVTGSTLAFADVLLGTVLFLPLPQSLLARLGKNIDGALHREWRENSYLEVIRTVTQQQTQAVASVFANLGNVLARDGPPGRQLASRLHAAGRAIDGLGRELDMQLCFERDLEGGIRDALRQSGYSDVRGVNAYRPYWGGLQVRLEMSGCGGNRPCDARLEPMVSKACGFPMKVVHKRCAKANIRKGRSAKICSVWLEQKAALRVEVGLRVRPRAGQVVSGDTVASARWDGSHHTLCLSDGMGSGKAAHAHSSTVVRLVFDLMQAGANCGDALQAANRLMQVVGSEEMFSTVDVCQLDLLDKKAEFIKMGAAPGYLLRQGMVRCLRAQSLPIGVLEEIDCQHAEVDIRAGDVILLMSDGVADALGEGIEGTLAGIPIRMGARRIADALVAQALERQQEGQVGVPRQDDMSVIVACVQGA